MRTITRGLCFGYWTFLTVLLLVPDPGALLGWNRLGVAPPNRGVHLLFFAALALLYHASRFPLATRTSAVILLGYALAVESLQYFTPPRTVELLDYAENLLGLAAGTLASLIYRRWRERPTKRR